MSRIQWARASQFNWVFDNLGGTPLQEAVAGNWSGATAQVEADGKVTVQSPNPGGGQVYYVRGVWLKETVFPWDGFWADPLEGDLTNYYPGGAFANQGAATVITLGTALPAGTPVQLFYVYFTGEKATRYEALNNYPCIRRAYRSRDDYSYDFAVDRLLDLMVCLHEAGEAQGADYGPMLRFLWEAFYPREASLTSPLVYDSFERQAWGRGAYLLYRGTTAGADFPVFDTETATGGGGRVLHVRAELPTLSDGAWWGYGLDWSLQESPFAEVDRVTFKLQGQAESRHWHNLSKSGNGSATLVLLGDYTHQEPRRFVVQIETGGEVGQATFRWSRDGGQTWEASGLKSGDHQHPVSLWGGLEVCWEGGAGTDLVAGDYWTFWAGEPAEHPRRLLVCLNDSIPGDPNPWGPEHLYLHAVPDRFEALTAFEVPFPQFWRRDNLIDDRDRVRAMWGAWYSAVQPDDSQIYLSDREATEILFGDTFYTQLQVTWDLTPFVTAFGVWAGIDPQNCDSTGHTQVNFLLKPVVSGANNLTLRVKVKDAQGSYFYKEVTVQVNAWQRVGVNLAEMELESGSLPLTHPLQAVDIGVPSSPPSNGTFYLTDLKFDEHLTFSEAPHLRLLEFKLEQQGLTEHEWWLDEVGLNLEAEDPYPYAPRLAISLTPYGQNPWRGPTLVHYAQPLAPYLVGALNLSQHYLNLHRDAQEEFHRRYGGVKGPILPVHTRNDVENIALCGCENFGKFCWWPRHRNYGQVSGAWHFNEALTDASGHEHTLSWSSGSPVYTLGVCQPGNTAIAFDGSGHASLASNSLFEPGTQPFSLTLIIKGAAQGSSYRWVVDKMGSDGWVIQTKEAGSQELQLKVTTTGGDSYSDIPGVLDGDWHMLTWMVAPAESKIYKIKDGVLLGYDSLAVGIGLNNTAYLNIGASAVFDLDYFKYERRLLPAAEYQEAWDIARGLKNGSAYPEVGYALGQFWAFSRLAEYYFYTNDPAAWEVLQNWINWIDAYGLADGEGWNFPLSFSEYGFNYPLAPGSGWFEEGWFESRWFGTLEYDAGAAAAIAIGCLYIYLRNGNAAAQTWARRILDDLRQNRGDLELGGYRQDYHYAWLNAQVAQAFGLAVNGRPSQAYPFPGTPEDQTHFENLISWFFRRAGEGKPNILNSDLIPFTYLEAADVWDYAPHYLFLSQMGSLEAVVLMAGAALEYGQAFGDWTWFERLLRFILVDTLGVLRASQIAAISASYELAGVNNLVRVRYADYDQDNSKYAEARDQAAVTAFGEMPLELDCRYGQPVVLENPEMAAILASRLLQRLATPWEQAEVTTWLEGLRLELGDTVAVSSDFHGLERAEFTVWGKAVDLKKRRVHLDLARPLICTWAWAVDAAGGDYDCYAIDQNSHYDRNWDYRTYAG
jgi:hypothetical protein